MVRFQVCRIQRSSGTFLTVSKADGGERPEEVKLPAAAHRYATEGGICDSKVSVHQFGWCGCTRAYDAIQFSEQPKILFDTIAHLDRLKVRLQPSIKIRTTVKT